MLFIALCCVRYTTSIKCHKISAFCLVSGCVMIFLCVYTSGFFFLQKQQHKRFQISLYGHSLCFLLQKAGYFLPCRYLNIVSAVLMTCLWNSKRILVFQRTLAHLLVIYISLFSSSHPFLLPFLAFLIWLIRIAFVHLIFFIYVFNQWYFLFWMGFFGNFSAPDLLLVSQTQSVTQASSCWRVWQALFHRLTPLGMK